MRPLLTFILLSLAYPLMAQNAEYTKQAKDFSELGFGMFIHFGVNTFTDQEWTDGTVPASVFSPKNLDTDQWCEAAKSAGMQYVVITSKHHDGFCLWNTRLTNYSVKSAPVSTDVIKQLSKSCKKYGLKLGLYYSLWDRHEKSYTDNYAYTEFMKGQLKELLTNYGDITMIWFDGVWDKCTGFGYDGEKLKGEEIMHAWRNDGAFRWQWDQIYSYIKHLSPDCLVMNNSGIDFSGIPLLPVDIRSGERANKSNTATRSEWTFAGKTRLLPLQIEETLSKKYWFFHEGDTSVKSKEEILQLLSDAKTAGANLLLNVGPTTEGLLRKEDVMLLKSLQQKQ